MSTSIGSLRYVVSADISDYTAKLAQLKAMRQTASKEEKLAIDKQIKLLRDQQRKEKQILRDRSKAYNDFANTIRSSVKWISVGLVGVVATASKNLMDMERETKNLSAALSGLGSNNQELLSTLTNLADQINEITGINQQSINDAMAIGLQFGIAQDDIDDYAKALAALSSISGKSMQQLAQSLNQMYIKGDFSSLEKLGIYIDQNKSKQQQFNDVIAQGLEKYNELNNQTSGTLTRNMRVLGNVAGSVFEEIGKRINDNVITPLATWFNTNREVIINITSKSTDIITNNWRDGLATLLTLYSTFNKAAKKQTDIIWSDIKTVITDSWRKSGQSIDLFRNKINYLYSLTTQAINALVDWNNMTIDQRRNVMLNKDHTVLNRIIASADLLHIKAGKTNKTFFDVNNTLTTTNKIILTTGKILLDNVAVVKTLRVAVLGVAAVGKMVNTVFRTTLALAKGIGRALVVMAVMEAAIWAIEKAIDGCVWAWKKYKGQVILTEEEQDKLNGLLQVSKSLDEQIKAAKEEQVYLTAKLNKKTEEQAQQAVRKNSIEALTKQLNEEQNKELKKQIQHQIDQVKELDKIKTENAKIKSQIDEQKNTAQEVNNIEKDTVDVEKQKTTELIKQQDSLSALYKTTSDLNAKWNDMVKPTDNINVIYKQYKDTLNDIKTVQNEIYANQRNLVIDEETRNKNNVILVTKYNDLLSKRNNLTQSLLTAKKQEQSLRQQEEEAERQRVERQKQEAEALNVKRNQLKLQLEIAKAENSGNKDRAAALKIGQEVNKIAEEYKLSIKDALNVYKTLNKEKEAGNGGIQTQPLTKQQQRKQERAKRNLERYEASLATAPGEERKTGVRRISASKEAVERWRREAAGDFSGGNNSKKESVLSRITAKQIEANMPSTSSIEPIIPTTQAATTNSTTTTTQTGAQQAQKAGGTLQNVISKIDDLINSFNTFTGQFAQTFSS